MKTRWICFAMTWIAATSAVAAEPGPARATAGRTILLNEAADALVSMLPLPGSPKEAVSAEQAIAGLRAKVDQYADTRVSHLMLNVCYQRACFASRVWESYWDVDDPSREVTGWPRCYWMVHKAGVDPFAVSIARCRERGISPWLSIRMNDNHYIDEQCKTSRLWWNHPEYRTRPNAGFDYNVPAVRDRYLALVAELVQRYDCDGVELDWMRFAHHFKWSEGVKGCAVLTDFMRQARRLTAAAAVRRGHAVGLSVRVPGSPDFAVALGMDGVTWAREQLIDILVPTCTWMPTDFDMPLEQWRERIGPAAQHIKLAAGADLWVKCMPQGPVMRHDLESMRGFAASAFDRGADCIYLFNHFSRADFRRDVLAANGRNTIEDYYIQHLIEAASPSGVVDKPRRHVLTYCDTVPPGAAYRALMPAELRPGTPLNCRLHLGPRPSSGKAVVRLGLADLPGFRDCSLAVRINGEPAKAIEDLNRPGQFVPRPKSGFYNVHRVEETSPRIAHYEVAANAIRQGFNDLAIEVQGPAGQQLVWLEVRLVPGD